MLATKINSPFVFLLAIILAGFVVVKITDNPVIVPKAEKEALNIKSWQTSNGARVMYVYAEELPMLDVRVVFDAGSARDGDKPGLASMTNLMLDLGAGQWTTDQIAERLDSVGANIRTTSLRDMAIVSMRSLSNDAILNKSLDTLAAVLQQPRFPVTELERERKQVLIALQNKLQSPDDIAEELFYKTLYGKHPYATPSMGTTESVRKISRADLKAFYQQYYVASNAVIALVGDVDEKQAREITEKLTSGLAKGQRAKRVANVAELTKAKEIKHQHPSTQTHILVG
ncbi:MAG: insulinase family protein, partial [Gammaproteobacteria bacterium]|nr:insulinase family protein [Gammaproteobacteria bacterium]